MTRLGVVSLLLVTAGSTWFVTKTLEGKQRQRLERWGHDAEMRAVRAEKRFQAYKRTMGGDDPAPPGEISIPGPAAVLATVAFPFEEEIADLAKRLQLDDAQTRKLRRIYEQRWALAKQVAASGVVPAGTGAVPTSAEAASFLSAAQLRKLQQIEEGRKVEVPRMAAEHASQLAKTLGLTVEQTRRAANALADIYRNVEPTSSASRPIERVKQTLRPILNDEQWSTLVASLEDSDLPVAASAPVAR